MQHPNRIEVASQKNNMLNVFWFLFDFESLVWSEEKKIWLSNNVICNVNTWNSAVASCLSMEAVDCVSLIKERKTTIKQSTLYGSFMSAKAGKERTGRLCHLTGKLWYTCIRVGVEEGGGVEELKCGIQEEHESPCVSPTKFMLPKTQIMTH